MNAHSCTQGRWWRVQSACRTVWQIDRGNRRTQWMTSHSAIKQRSVSQTFTSRLYSNNNINTVILFYFYFLFFRNQKKNNTLIIPSMILLQSELLQHQTIFDHFEDDALTICAESCRSAPPAARLPAAARPTGERSRSPHVNHRLRQFSLRVFVRRLSAILPSQNKMAQRHGRDGVRGCHDRQR